MVRLAVGFMLGVAALPATSLDGAFVDQQQRYSRVRQAFEHQRDAVQSAFAAVGAAWPPKRLLLRAYKREGVLEIFAQDAGQPDDQVLVRRLPICASSGGLGPKSADRQRSQASDLGGDIFVHGGCATIGCLPLTDALMEWVYVAAVVARSYGQRIIPVQILPCQFEDERCEAELLRRAQDQPELGKFWAKLRQPLTL